jgi:cytokinin dehydrogenase
VDANRASTHSEKANRLSDSLWTAENIAKLVRETGVTVLHDPATRADASQDFGRMVEGASQGVALPRDVGELAKLVAWASARGLPLTPRGRGYSQSGQSIPAAGGLSVSCARLDRVERPSPAGTMEAGGGARLREVLQTAAAEGMCPPVLPLNLDMSVGGLLSAAGIGANSHRFGTLASHVRELEVVTGTGAVVRCSDRQEEALFHAALAGLGRCGFITRATLPLRPLGPPIRSVITAYTSLKDWLDDHQELASEGRCQFLEAFCWAGPRGMRSTPTGRRPFVRWSFSLHAGYAEPEAPAPRAQPDGRLALGRGEYLHADDLGAFEHAFRHEPRFELMRRSGAWNKSHPWFECFVTRAAAPELLKEALDFLPVPLGDGARFFFLTRSDRTPYFALPGTDERVAAFTILPLGLSGSDLAEASPVLTRLAGLVEQVGGTRYWSGWLGTAPGEAFWQAHLGGRYEAWRAAKRRYDPRGILSSLLLPAPTATKIDPLA